MFATLRYGTVTNELAVCAQPTDRPPFQGQGHQHSACDNCRAKKLKCTGQKTGCDRCRGKGIACQFTNPADNTKGGQKRRRRRQTSVYGPDQQPTESPLKLRTPSEPAAVMTGMDDGNKAKGSPGSAQVAVGTEQENDRVERYKENEEDISHAAGSEEPDSLLADVDFADLMTLVTADTEHDEAASNLGYCTPRDPDAPGHTTYTPESFFPLSPPDTADFVRGMYGADDLDSTMLDLGSPGEETPWGFPASMPSPGSIDDQHPVRTRAHSLVQKRPHSHAAHESAPDLQPSEGSECHCTHQALSILEDLEAKNNRMDFYGVDHILSVQKRALGQCSAILGCSKCTKSSGFMMLLVTICEKTLNSFDRTATGAPEEQKIAYLGDYLVDSPKEWHWVISVIAVAQLNRLKEVMSRLKALAVEFNWHTHISMILAHERRLQNAALRANLRLADAGVPCRPHDS